MFLGNMSLNTPGEIFPPELFHRILLKDIILLSRDNLDLTTQRHNKTSRDIRDDEFDTVRTFTRRREKSQKRFMIITC